VSGFLSGFWRDLGEDEAALAAVRSDGRKMLPLLPSPLPVGLLAHDAVAAATLEAALAAGETTPFEIDPARVATAYTSERHFRIDGAVPMAWAELSGFWPTQDGWLRTHGNYPHHRIRLLSALGLAEGAGRNEVSRALSDVTALEAERRIVAAGGIAAAVRTPEEWSASEPGVAAAAGPVVALSRLGDGPPMSPIAAEPGEPLSGVRVLDLTRVIAGPVATRTLALLGADVLRIDPPAIPEPANQWLDTGAGKRSLLLDLASSHGAATFEELLEGADVVVTGYRPGSLDALGLDPESLAARRPGIVVARLSAWGTAGPWAERRGFDSIVQAASGVATVSGDGEKPGALPAQALDHTAGYLLAAAVIGLLRRREAEGGSWLAETSLARIAAELLAAPRESADPVPLVPTLLERESPSGRLTYPAPALPAPPAGPDWDEVGARYGAASPEWVSI
jgi:hypothetical protein